MLSTFIIRAAISYKCASVPTRVGWYKIILDSEVSAFKSNLNFVVWWVNDRRLVSNICGVNEILVVSN